MESRANELAEGKESDSAIQTNSLISSTNKINSQLHSKVDRSLRVNSARDDENRNPYVLHKLKDGFDFLVLALIFAGNDLIKSNCDFGGYNKITCFISAGLYFKFRNVLNPMRDELGIYQYLLSEAKKRVNPDSPPEIFLRKRTSHLDSEAQSSDDIKFRKKV